MAGAAAASRRFAVTQQRPHLSTEDRFVSSGHDGIITPADNVLLELDASPEIGVTGCLEGIGGAR
jgi:hypothetical protein